MVIGKINHASGLIDDEAALVQAMPAMTIVNGLRSDSALPDQLLENNRQNETALAHNDAGSL
ncbi:MAG: hypothetical protein ABL862_08350 [Candidatus Nitrotoga sp.]